MKQEVAVLNSEGNVAIGVKIIQEQLEYKILILLWSCGLLHLTRKREEKVSENILCVCVFRWLFQIITVLKKLKVLHSDQKARRFLSWRNNTHPGKACISVLCWLVNNVADINTSGFFLLS